MCQLPRSRCSAHIMRIDLTTASILGLLYALYSSWLYRLHNSSPFRTRLNIVRSTLRFHLKSCCSSACVRGPSLWPVDCGRSIVWQTCHWKSLCWRPDNCTISTSSPVRLIVILVCDLFLMVLYLVFEKLTRSLTAAACSFASATTR